MHAPLYSPSDSLPEIWPSPLGVQRVLVQFKKMPEMEQSKKVVNQESFLRQRIAKAKEQLKKQQKDNREKEVTQVMFQNLSGRAGLHNLNMIDLNDLGWLVDQKLREIHHRTEAQQKSSLLSQLAATAAAAADGVVVKSSGTHNVEEEKPPNLEEVQRQQWYMADLMMNSNDQLNFGTGDDIMPPFADTNHLINGLWSNSFFPNWDK